MGVIETAIFEVKVGGIADYSSCGRRAEAQALFK
jgi:hypothetical protein